MSDIAIKKDQEYLSLMEELEKQVNKNNELTRGREKEIERNIDEVELALHELFGNKRFDKSTYLKIKLQK
jgi:hypothetical protein